MRREGASKKKTERKIVNGRDELSGRGRGREREKDSERERESNTVRERERERDTGREARKET